MALRTESRVYVPTPNGDREVQLCIGDITALPVEDKVDVLLISSLPGDYIPTRTSVIGALYRTFGLNVEVLSRNKREDLRKQCNCWIADIPKRENSPIPYDTLICFERSLRPTYQSGMSPNEIAVKEIFRAMMPIFNNKNTSVITPLLATGDQGNDKASMLKIMVKVAIEWMKIGLPLQTFKIVLYGKVDARGNFAMRNDTRDCIDQFKQLSSSLSLDKRSYPVSINKDVYIISSQQDETVRKTVVKGFKKELAKPTIISANDVPFKEGSEEFSIFKTMCQCQRVVPIITDNFLKEVRCLDEYNVALCVNRFQRRPILTPLCMEKGLKVPVYMSLVQWINVRPPNVEMIINSCRSIVEHISTYTIGKNRQYDVFISYAHKNLTAAKVFVETFQKVNNNLKVFFDYDSLKTGFSWQQTLYQAIDDSRCFVALLSPDYLKSPVCNEEFNLALAKYASKEKGIDLLPIMIQDCPELPSFDLASPTKIEGDQFESTANTVCTDISDWINTDQLPKELFPDVDFPLDIIALSKSLRKLDFEKNYRLNNGTIGHQKSCLVQGATNPAEENGRSQKTVFISHNLRDQKYASLLGKLFEHFDPELNVTTKIESESQAMELIQNSDCIVVLLSTNFQNSEKHVEELNTALTRQRSSPDNQVVYCLHLGAMKKIPTYFHLIYAHTSLSDGFWEKVLPGKDGLAAPAVDAMTEIGNKFEPFSVGEVLALTKVRQDVSAIAHRKRDEMPNRYSKNILINIADLQKNVEGFFVHGGKKNESEKDTNSENPTTADKVVSPHSGVEPVTEDSDEKSDLKSRGSSQHGCDEQANVGDMTMVPQHGTSETNSQEVDTCESLDATKTVGITHSEEGKGDEEKNVAAKKDERINPKQSEIKPRSPGKSNTQPSKSSSTCRII